METVTKRVVLSVEAQIDVIDISVWGESVFGFKVAGIYDNYLENQIKRLSKWYLMHPECRHLPTKQRIYRNIITDTHLVIYRITEDRIEVLRILHASSSIASIKKVRGVKI